MRASRRTSDRKEDRTGLRDDSVVAVLDNFAAGSIGYENSPKETALAASP